MAKKSIICPNCNAEIAAEPNQVFVYCMYCGVKIQTEDIVEIRYVKEPDSFEKMISDGEIYYKLEDYYRAELKFREVIKIYPQERAGYEELIRTLTRNQTMYPLAHEEEIYGLFEHLESMISEAEKEEFENRRSRIRESFDAERVRVEQMPKIRPASEEEQRWADRLVIKIVILSFLIPITLLFLLVGFNPGTPITVGLIILILYLVYSIWRSA